MAEYYDPDPHSAGKSYTIHGSFIQGADLFDHSCFGIAPVEASMMDPTHRCVLQVGYEAIYHAGYKTATLRGTATGVFVACLVTDCPRGNISSPFFMSALAGTIAANRISFLLGLRGPNLALDRACSASLVAGNFVF
jgi:acyl transferase domain-containing protein